MLGKDAGKVEYWHFKDDAARIFTRVEEPVYGENDEMTGQPVMVGTLHHWFYYDEEEHYELLLESLNPKGVRERKLQENLRKVKDRLKLRKVKKSVQEEIKEKPDVTGDVEMTVEGEGEASVAVDLVTTCEKDHVVFETDDFASSLNHACWFGLKCPPKRKFYGRNKTNVEDDESDYPQMNQLTAKLLEIESYY